MNDVIGPSSFQFPSDSTMVPEEPEESCVNDIFTYCNNLAFVKKLSDAKFPVYLVSYIPTNQHYAMKIFPWEDDAPSTFYLNEVRFGQFNHPNIVSMVYYVDEQDCSTNGVPSKVSYILMDYARYGDFFDVLITDKIPFNDMLIRTYFHQVIASLEALHSQGAAHLDVKLENLLLTEDFTLKLTDFDLSYMTGDGKVKTRGTKNFRAPEMLNGRCMSPQAADIYSAGIILFLMKTCGRVPYKEDSHHKGIDFEELKQNNPKEFWKKQCETLGKKATFFDEDFKTLFMWMTRNQPEKRPSIEEIKSSRWYKKEVYSEEELLVYMTGQYLGK